MAAAAAVESKLDILDCSKEVDEDGRPRKSQDPLCNQKCEDDPISMESIEENNLIRLNVNGVLRCYDIETLYEWLQRQHTEPITRALFSDEQVTRINNLYMLGRILHDPGQRISRDSFWAQTFPLLETERGRTYLRNKFLEVVTKHAKYDLREYIDNFSPEDFKHHYVVIEFILRIPISITKEDAKRFYYSQVFQMYYVLETFGDDDRDTSFIPNVRNRIFIAALPEYYSFILNQYTSSIPWYFYLFHAIGRFMDLIKQKISNDIRKI